MLSEIGSFEFGKYMEGLMKQNAVSEPQTLANQEDKGTISIGGQKMPIVTWDTSMEDYADKVVKSYDFTISGLNLRGLLDLNFEGDVPMAFSIMEMAARTLSSIDTMYINVDILNIDGEKKALIKFSDTAWANLKKEPGRGITDWEQQTTVYLDSDHTKTEFGYIYEQDGKLMLSVLVYPGDQYAKQGIDVTHQFYAPLEFSEEMTKKN